MIPWPWRRTPPGWVRVDAGELVETLTGALRAAELEAEIARMATETRTVEAWIRATEVLDEWGRAGAVDVTAVPVQLLAEDLPYDSHGELHEAAYAALVRDRLASLRS